MVLPSQVSRLTGLLSPGVKRWIIRNQALALRMVNPLRNRFIRRRNVGSGSYISPLANVLGWRWVMIGSNSIISEGTCINVNNRCESGFRIVIGNCCFIGRRNFFSNGEKIVIKDYCMTGLDCHLNGANHIYSDPFLPYIATGVTTNHSITLGVNTWLGTDVTIVGNVEVGHGSIVGAGSLITKSIPPFSVAIGNPARVIKRFDIKAKAWIPVADFSPEMEEMLPREEDYLAMLKRNRPFVNMPRAAAGCCQGDLP